MWGAVVFVWCAACGVWCLGVWCMLCAGDVWGGVVLCIRSGVYLRDRRCLCGSVVFGCRVCYIWCAGNVWGGVVSVWCVVCGVWCIWCAGDMCVMCGVGVWYMWYVVMCVGGVVCMCVWCVCSVPTCSQTCTHLTDYGLSSRCVIYTDGCFLPYGACISH